MLELELELLEGAELLTDELVLATEEEELLGLDELLVATLDELTTLDETELLELEFPPWA